MSDDKSKTYTHSARIPLPFGALIAQRKPSNRLPIPFTRPLRHIASGGTVAPIEPPKPKPPEPYAPRQAMPPYRANGDLFYMWQGRGRLV